MKDEEAQRLLGGYATNSLTEAERKELFEAALGDQELFDALQKEQALKDLLDDEITRAQVRQALARGAPAPRPWWGRWWTWSFAAAALAVASVALIVKLSNPPTLRTSELAVAKRQDASDARFSGTLEPKLDAPAPPAKGPSDLLRALARAEREKKVEARRSAKEELTHSDRDRKDVSAVESAKSVAPPAPSPSPAAPAAPDQIQPATQAQTQVSQDQVAQQFRVQNQVAAPPAAAPPAADSLRDQQPAAQPGARAARTQSVAGTIGGLAGMPATQKPPTLTYSALKQTENGGYTRVDQTADLHPGDAVRLSISAPVAGFLQLYERSASGEWEKRLGPSGLNVTANTPVMVPDQPIAVRPRQQLRLVLSPTPTISAALLEKGGSNSKTVAEKKANEIPPQPGALVVNIELNGNR